MRLSARLERAEWATYKARDTRLNRFVAIKVLSADRMADEGRKQRFIWEAQTASAPNHPNIIWNDLQLPVPQKKIFLE